MYYSWLSVTIMGELTMAGFIIKCIPTLSWLGIGILRSNIAEHGHGGGGWKPGTCLLALFVFFRGDEVRLHLIERIRRQRRESRSRRNFGIFLLFVFSISVILTRHVMILFYERMRYYLLLETIPSRRAHMFREDRFCEGSSSFNFIYYHEIKCGIPPQTLTPKRGTWLRVHGVNLSCERIQVALLPVIPRISNKKQIEVMVGKTRVCIFITFSNKAIR